MAAYVLYAALIATTLALSAVTIVGNVQSIRRSKRATALFDASCAAYDRDDISEGDRLRLAAFAALRGEVS
jgi:hypothetical protein